MDDLAIRAWTEDDMDVFVRLRREVDPWVPEEALRQSVDSDQRRYLSRWIAEVGGEPVGYAHVMRYTDEPDDMAYVVVAEGSRGQGLGGRLFATLLEGPRERPWLSDVAEGDGADVARHWGFVEIERSIMSRLVLAGAALEAPEPEGGRLRILTSEEIVAAGLEEQVDDSVRRSSTHPEAKDLGWVMTVAWALTDPGSLWALLVDGEGLIVATTYASPTGDGDWMLMWTGVVPEHRGRGAGRVVKQALHRAIAERGGVSVMTGNEARNTRIRELNASLGYVEESVRLRLRRPLGA